MAAGMIFMMQAPLLHQPSTFVPALSGLKVSPATSIAWPHGGSSALVIPALGVAVPHHDAVLPIASLTKMMTAYVTLSRLPLAPQQKGPCIRVNAADVSYDRAINADGESNAAVAVGEVLCEYQLLDGLLVHSAGNFATMLANLAWGGTKAFVAHMNAEAGALGLRETHYADVSGVDPGSVSTALDQGELAARLMQFPVVRSIVEQPTVTLPVAGTLGSYTPFVGTHDVVGVKSGRTQAAGGCDVMAMTFSYAGSTQLAYAVVLGARGGDLLGPAGDEALALDGSVVHSQHILTLAAGTVVGTLGWADQRVNVVLQRHLNLDWFSALTIVSARAQVFAQLGAVNAGQVVGWLSVAHASTPRVPLTVARRISPLTVLQRMR